MFKKISMKIVTLLMDSRSYRYLVFQPYDLPSEMTLTSSAQTAAFEAMASSRFYMSLDGQVIAKVVPDKFSRRNMPLKWWLRDYLEKRWLGQSDAHKEYASLKILHRAGLYTPRCYGWGISLSGCNANASLLLMEHVQDSYPGEQVFRAMSEPQRLDFLELFCQEVAQLARFGYVHRDLHYNNVLVTPTNKLIWIDAHVRRMPRNAAGKQAALALSLTPDKLGGDAYHRHVQQRLDCLLAFSASSPGGV